MLTSKQRAYLRSLAATVEPILHVGKGGVSPTMLKQADDALTARELLKGRVLETAPEEARPTAQKVADAAGAELVLVLPVAWKLLKEGAEMVCLVKPQFEAGKDKVGKKGVVREPQIHREVIEKVVDCAQQLGFSVMGLDFSPIKGPEGNIEYLLFLQKPVGAEQAQLCLNEESVGQVVQNAHESLS